jgi:hypothetical protein
MIPFVDKCGKFLKKDISVNAHKIAAYIKFQNPRGMGIIAAAAVNEPFGAIDAKMSSFPDSA